MRDVAQKNFRNFHEMFLWIISENRLYWHFDKIEEGFHARSIENAMSIQALQESFQNILVSESYQRNRDEMLKKFHTSNSAENPLFSTYD